MSNFGFYEVKCPNCGPVNKEFASENEEEVIQDAIDFHSLSNPGCPNKNLTEAQVVLF